MRAVARAGWRFAVVGAVLALLSSCYLPNDFKAEIRITRYGDYAMTFMGDLVYGPLYEDISKNKLKPPEAEEKVATLLRDLRRDKAWDPTTGKTTKPLFTEIAHKGKGVFRVRYEREGQLDSDALVTFVRRNNNILSLKSEKGVIVVSANTLAAHDAQRIMALGLDMKGEFRVVTDAEVLDHNANTVRPYAGYLVYIWQIENALAPAPRLVMRQAARK